MVSVAGLLALGRLPIPLDRVPGASRALQALGGGVQLRADALRVDLLAARGLVLLGAQASSPVVTIRVPELVVRPRWAGSSGGGWVELLGKRHEAELRVPPARLLGDGLSPVAFMAQAPRCVLHLRGGRWRSSSGLLLEDAELRIDPTRPQRFRLAGRRGREGRVEVTIRRDSVSNEARALLVADRADLSDWLAAPAARFGALEEAGRHRGLAFELSGSWSARERDGRRREALDLTLHAVPGAASASDPERPAVLTLRLVGAVARRSAVSPAAPGSARSGKAALSGGIRIEGSFAGLRLHPAALGKARGVLLLTGPFEGAAWIRTSAGPPRFAGWISLDRVHGSAGRWLAKRAGKRAQLAVAGGAALPFSEAEAAFALGALRGRLRVGAGGRLEGRTAWLEARELAPLVPALSDWLQGGRVRFELQADPPARGPRLRAQLERVELGAGTPLGPSEASGWIEFGPGRIRAPRLWLRTAAGEMRLDAAASPSGGSESGWRVEVTARARRLELSEPSGGIAPLQLAEQGDPLPAPLAEAAAWCANRLRARAAQLGPVHELEIRLASGELAVGAERVRDLGMRARVAKGRIELPTLGFRSGGRLWSFRGSVRLDALVARARWQMLRPLRASIPSSPPAASLAASASLAPDSSLTPDPR